MDYKGYYSLSYTAEKEPTNIWFNYIYAGKYSFEVNEADGLETNGEAGGKFYFTCQVDDEESEIDWDTIDEEFEGFEADFSIEDESFNPIDFKGEFEVTLIDDDGNKHTYRTTDLL